MPSPERRSSGISRSAEWGARPRGSPRRPRTSTSTGSAAGVPTVRVKPMTGQAGLIRSRRSCPRLPDGSSESPRTTEGGAPSLGHGTQVFPGQASPLVHRTPRFCELLAPWRREQGPRKPTTGRRGRRRRTWQEKMGDGSLEARRWGTARLYAGWSPSEPFRRGGRPLAA